MSSLLLGPPVIPHKLRPCLNKVHNWLIFREFGLFFIFLFLGSAFWQLLPSVAMVRLYN